jgi:hypothetical protein
MASNAKPETSAARPQTADEKRRSLLMKLATGEITLDEADKVLQSEQSSGPARSGPMYFKVSVKGAISAYGLQRMPVTLYVEQWERILGKRGECSSAFALSFWDFVTEWDGKEFKSTRTDPETKKTVEYTAKISRKARE